MIQPGRVQAIACSIARCYLDMLR